MELVRGFAGLGREDLALAGGKGANLGEMVQAGLPVPPGFVLLTPAYRAFVAVHSLQPEIEKLAGAVRADDAPAVEAASAAIRALFDGRPVPAAIAGAVAAAYADMGAGPVAVRSSATAEDLPGASFAGQQETYLNISGPDAVLAAVVRCWSSLWTARAISYRARQGIRPADVALAVVVQRLVASEAAGVLFTANPVNGRRDQVVIDGAWGLGEAVVSGQVTPDRWVAHAGTGAVLEHQIGSKQVQTVRTPDGVETRPVPPALQGRPVLNPAGVAALVNLGRRVAAHYGAPQDIEWAVAGGQLYLLQARPITSLFPLPQPEPPPEAGLRVYVSFNNLQGLVEPFTPMGMENFRAVIRGLARLMRVKLPPGGAVPALKMAALRLYVDVTVPLRHRKLRQVIQGIPTLVDRPMTEILRALTEREPERLSLTGTGRPLHPPAGFVLAVLGRLVRALLWPDLARRRAIGAFDAAVQDLERQLADLHGLRARLDFLQAAQSRLFPLVLGRMGPVVFPAVAMRFVAEDKLKQWLGDAAGLQPVLRSLPHNPTTEMDLALWRLSRVLKAEGAQPTAAHPAVQGFLERYGHRAVREIDLGMPRWADDPAHVLNVLRTYLAHGEEADPERHFLQGARAAEQAAAALVARVRREKGILRAALLRFMLSRIRALVGLRELPKFYLVKMMGVFRRALAGAGTELVAAGRLDRADDVFFLTLADLASDRDLRSVAAANRAEYERELGRRAIPRVMTSTGETFYGAPTVVAGALVGTAASPGVYEGRVRVIREPQGAKLEQGEVLVAPGTDPAWTPLFLTAGALVMEIGGIMSHGSVVAREYGIPAVVGVPGATQRLRTGQRVRVDGESGQVVALD